MTTTPHLVKPETQVNSTDGGTAQNEAAITPLQDGGYAVVWTDNSRTYNTAGEAIVGQRYDSAGNKVGGDPAHGGEVMLSQFLNSGSQFEPAVTTLANGNIAVAFTDVFNGNDNVIVRVFDPSLQVIRTDNIEISNMVQGFEPALTALADGGYAVSYTVGSNIHVVGRVVSAAGSVGDQFNIDTPVDDLSHLATLSNGNVVAAFRDEFFANGSSIPTDTDIIFSIFTPAGTPVLIHEHVPGGATDAMESQPNVAALHGGGFVVTWTEPASSGSDIHASIIGNDGHTFIATDLLVNTTTAGTQSDSDVVALGDGGFLVTWSDNGLNVTHGQRFDAVGDKIGAEFMLDTGGPTNHRDAALLSDGRIAFGFDAFSSDSDVNNSIFTIGVADAHVHDVNGDGSGDFLWRNDNGATGIWELRNGQPVASASVGFASPDWQVAATGDFNGDGKSDILWHNDNGATSIWELNGSSVIAAASVGSASPDWHIATTGDFNGDGKSDILWHNDNGATSIWELDGTSVIAAASVGSASPDWHIATTGDFNGDGKSDVLWHNDNGAVGIWELDGTSVVAAASVGSASPDWQIARTGDFNGDGHSDILWRNDNGAVGIWELNGSSVVAAASVGSASPDWHIADTGDFNGDGKSDIVWHNDNGATSIWELDGGHVIGVASLGTVSTDWHLLT
jgi:FG-GAP-like repeat